MDLRSIADKRTDMFKDNVEAKCVRFEVSFQDFDTYCLVGDETRLCQVLINFVSNAVKFTSDGEITITFRQMFKKNGKVDFMVKVHDTGTGIKAEVSGRRELNIADSGEFTYSGKRILLAEDNDINAEITVDIL